MTSLNYQKIYSKFFTKVTAYDFLELTNEQANEFLCNWLHSAVRKPYIRRLFKSFTMDDEIQVIKYEMKYEIDNETDEEFIIEIFSLGMVLEWLDPKINSILNISQMFGTKEQKFYAQSNHLSELQSLNSTLYKKQRRMIVDRGYAWNSYIDGE